MARIGTDRILQALWSDDHPDTRLYAVLDGARDERIHRAVLTSGCEHHCLLRGELAPDMAEVAPYVVQLAREHPLASWIVEQGWGESWGIFARARAELRAIRNHLRSLMVVYGADGKPMYFRYYDPRVLRVYLPTCNDKELASIFGPVQSYLLESDESTEMIGFSSAAGALQTQKRALAAVSNERS